MNFVKVKKNEKKGKWTRKRNKNDNKTKPNQTNGWIERKAVENTECGLVKRDK